MAEINLCICCKRYPVEHGFNKCESCNAVLKHSLAQLKNTETLDCYESNRIFINKQLKTDNNLK